MIKTGIIGYGFSAKTFHIPFLRCAELLKWTSISTSSALAVNTDFPEIECFESAEQLIVNSDVDLIIITSPNHTHYDLAKLCLQNGKHVLVEKPFVTRSSQAIALFALAEQQSLVLTVYQNRRWDGDFLTAQQLIKQKKLGDVRFFESHFDRFRPQVRDRWREQPGDGAGIWFDLGPHLVDQAIDLFGKPKAITARLASMRDGSKTTDYFHVQLHYQDIEVVLQSSPFSAGPNIRFQIQGDQGSYVKYGLDPQESRLLDGEIPDKPDWAQEQNKDFGTIYLNTESGIKTSDQPTLCGGYQHFFQQLEKAILSGTPAPVTADEAIWLIQILETAEKSSELGKSIALD